jgi:hypothetical protein
MSYRYQAAERFWTSFYSLTVLHAQRPAEVVERP